MYSAARIGNWQESEVLKSIGADIDFKDKSQQTKTKLRVIEHDDKLEPSQYSSTLRSTYPDPKSVSNFQHKPQVGPREKAREAQLRELIDEEFEINTKLAAEAAMERDMTTTTQRALNSTGFTPKSRQEHQSRFDTQNKDYATETAVTFYSHELEHKDNLGFSSTVVTDLKKPWSKVSQVSEDLGNGTRRVRENWEHPHPLPSLIEVKSLQTLRTNLLNAIHGTGVPGSRIRELFTFLLSFDKDGKGWIYVEEVADELNRIYGIQWTEAEKLALLRAFDHDRCHKIPPGRMRLREFMDLIRATLSPRKQEIVDIVFSIIDRSKSGYITIDDIVTAWQGSEEILDSLLQTLDVYNGTANNLLQSMEIRPSSYPSRIFSMFYKDYITEYGDDTIQFENFMESSWRL